MLIWKIHPHRHWNGDWQICVCVVLMLFLLLFSKNYSSNARSQRSNFRIINFTKRINRKGHNKRWSLFSLLFTSQADIQSCYSQMLQDHFRSCWRNEARKKQVTQLRYYFTCGYNSAFLLMFFDVEENSNNLEFNPIELLSLCFLNFFRFQNSFRIIAELLSSLYVCFFGFVSWWTYL